MTAHPLITVRRFAVGHPYVGEWSVLAAGTLAALLLWFWNS